MPGISREVRCEIFRRQKARQPQYACSDSTYVNDYAAHASVIITDGEHAHAQQHAYIAPWRFLNMQTKFIFWDDEYI